MIKWSNSSGKEPEQPSAAPDFCESGASYLVRMRREALWAAALLFAPWLASLYLFRSFLPDESITPALLLPGLAIAVYLLLQLICHLPDNHSAVINIMGEKRSDGRDNVRLYPNLGVANWITLFRAAAVVALAGFLPLVVSKVPIDHRLSFIPGCLYLSQSLADLVDGLVARKQNRETELGKKLDIETDAAGLLVASLLAVALKRLPPLYLLVGLAYYPFILGTWLRKKRGLPLTLLQSRPYARIIAGCQMGLVGMVLLPFFNPVCSHLAGYFFMTPLLLGFYRDWLVVSCRLETTGEQQTHFDRLAQRVSTEIPLLLRALLLVGFIVLLFGNSIAQDRLIWLMVTGVCCLLMVAGILLRTMALLLILLFGWYKSPFGVTAEVFAIFVPAVNLVLFGPGRLFLWAPEEDFIYRRPAKKKKFAGKMP